MNIKIFQLHSTMIYSGFFTVSLLLCLSSNSVVLAQSAGGNKIKDSLNDVALHVDPRIDIIYQHISNNSSSTNLVVSNPNQRSTTGSIHSARGYRVLIYSGIDRAKANNIKADFMRRYPGTRVYMTYALPQYKIKVGDFSNRQEAGDLYRQLSSQYSPCMVVPDIVEINTFRKND